MSKQTAKQIYIYTWPRSGNSKLAYSLRSRGYSCATVYDQKIGALYSAPLETALFIKCHEIRYVPGRAPIVSIARDLGECLCSAADYVCGGDLEQTLVLWKTWFGGIENYFETIERRSVHIIGYNRIDEGITEMVDRFGIKPDTQPLAKVELSKIIASNTDHFLCPMRSREQAARIEEANRLVRKAFPSVVQACERIGWNAHTTNE